MGNKDRFMNSKAQTMIEFSFSLIVVMLLFFGLIKVFVWSGKDIWQRGQAHTMVLTDNSFRPSQQIRPVFYYSTRMNAEIDSNFYGK